MIYISVCLLHNLYGLRSRTAQLKKAAKNIGTMHFKVKHGTEQLMIQWF